METKKTSEKPRICQKRKTAGRAEVHYATKDREKARGNKAKKSIRITTSVAIIVVEFIFLPPFLFDPDLYVILEGFLKNALC